MAQPVERKLQFSIYSCSGEVRRPRAPAHARAPARPAHAITPAAACTADVRGRACAQDPAYPAAELLRSGADARGWQSPKCAPRPHSRVSAVARPGGRAGAALRRAGAPGPGARASRWSWRWRSRSRRTWSACRSCRTSSRCAATPARRAAPPCAKRLGRILRPSSGQWPVRAPARGRCDCSPAAGRAAPGRAGARSQSRPAPASAAPLSAPLGAAAAREKAAAPPTQPGATQIAERLELFAGVVPPGGRDPHWQRLGSIGLDPNARSGYQVRPSPICARRLPVIFCSIVLGVERCALDPNAKRVRQPAPLGPAALAGLTRTASRSCAARLLAPPHLPDCRPMAALRCPALPYNPIPYARAAPGARAEDGGPARRGQSPALRGARLPR